jgi:predicted secreted protein
MAIVHGKGGAVKLGTPTANLVAAMNEWTLTSNADEVDTTSFGDTDKVWMAGFKDSSLTFSGFYDNADTYQGDLHEAFDAGTEVTIKLYTDGTHGFQGVGVVTSREVSASVSGAVTCNFGLRVNGSISAFTDTP